MIFTVPLYGIVVPRCEQASCRDRLALAVFNKVALLAAESGPEQIARRNADVLKGDGSFELKPAKVSVLTSPSGPFVMRMSKIRWLLQANDARERL
jgi:hypothetical protein